MAIAELEIELLTGRTHQIRGQLAAEGFPLVGDVQYGGATASLDVPRNNKSSQLLALQCCELSFALPKFVSNDKTKEIIGIPTDNWATFRLDDAWWSKHMHHQDSILV
jgi:23S rRNA-/tRNA-specific pseudouridylate synthase